MKKIVTLSMILLCAFLLKSQNVTYHEAQKVAQTFLSGQNRTLVECAYISEDETDTMLYIFNALDVFVVISGDKRCQPILAYSDKTVFSKNEVIQPVTMWIENYEKQIKSAKNQNIIPSKETINKWNSLLNNQYQNNRTSIEPFINSNWGQGKLYNYYCPLDNSGTNGRTLTGCVATAMSQLIHYFRFPETGFGSYSYEHSTYGTISANFGETTYQYASMADEPKNINLATSLLMHHCGVSVDMVYGPDGSGMYNHKAAYSLKTHFKFNPETQYCFRDSTTLNWDSLIVNHLQRRIPMYYAGWSVPNINGHAFICDGYQLNETDYYFHFNFGWDGSYNGYFYTNNLYVSGYNFNLAQELIINAYPDTLNYPYPNQPLVGTTVLTNESGSFNDGSQPIFNYENNMDYVWIIRPDFDSIKNIKLTITYNIAENDTLFVTFNNESIETQIITNNTSSQTYTFVGSEITLHFKSGDGITKQGFNASYTTTFPSYCSGIVYANENGFIEDGSGNKLYNNFTGCNFLIYVANATSITLDFTKFETELNKDFLYIYDKSDGKILLETLSGTLEQTVYTFYTNILELTFKTDELNTFDGWELYYTSSQSSIQEIDHSLDNIIIYPNPTSNQLYILNENVMIESVIVYDVNGRTVKLEHINDFSSNINVNHLNSGVYFIRIQTKSGSTIKKFIKY